MAIPLDEAEGQPWAAPGPGAWQADASHATGTVPPYMQALFGPAASAGFRRGFRNYGALLETIEVRVVAHRHYLQARPVGGPGRAAGGGPPPPFVFALLFRLHPELRFRARRAAQIFATRRWRQDQARWRQEWAPRLRATCRALQALDLPALDDDGLRGHLATLNELFVHGVELHFSLIPAATIPVGDWLAHVQAWTGADAREMLTVLRGYSAASVAPATLLDALAAAIRDSPAALQLVRTPSADAPAVLAQLRATSPRIATALAAYLDEHGRRLVTGFSLTDRTLLEMPDLLLRTIATSVDRAIPASGAPDVARAAAHLRARVPGPQQAEYDRLLAEARDLYGFRDEHSMDILWPAGLLRRAVQAAGRRLVARGRIGADSDVWEATPAELLALLGGAETAPAAATLAERAGERRLAEANPPPATLGTPAGDPPPLHGLPPACARLMQATLTYQRLLDEQHAEEASPTGGVLRGVGVSAGRYTGRARVVRGPADFATIVRGDVLVASTTSPAYNVVLPLLGALVTDRGGLLCHAAIVAREFGLPAVVGTGVATASIADGAWVVVDGTAGTVEVIR